MYTNRSILHAGLVGLAVLVTAGAAHAGQCPAGKTVASGQGQQAGATMPKGVTDTVLASTDLATEPVDVQGRLFRLRRLVIAPGGVVPWHSHADRPAMIYVVEGVITEYADTCAVPIVHKAGDVAPETHATAHWWKNTGKKTAVLLSADLFPSGDEPQEHMM